MTDTTRVTLPAEIDGGGVITMRKFTARDLLAIVKKELSNIELVELTLDAIVEYLPGRDPLDLAPEQIPEILDTWMTARREEALPPVTAESSREGSAGSRSTRRSR